MAIQLPNPGLGDGQTGDNEFVMWTKVKGNFTDQTNAASRLVGTGEGQVPVYTGAAGTRGIGGTGVGGAMPTTDNYNYGTNTVEGQEKGLGSGFYYLTKNGATNSDYPEVENTLSIIATFSFNQKLGWRLMQTPYANKWYLQSSAASSDGPWKKPCEIYHTGNTTKDTATGFLKASSPVLHVYNDSITKIHEAEQLDITVDKKGVGHYEIHGTTGLRKDDGWFMSPPRDVHANVLCMVDLEEKDGVIVLKTYKKLFDFETVSIVHDYDNPMDIPEGVCVEFRFNDLPQDDTQMEV